MNCPRCSTTLHREFERDEYWCICGWQATAEQIVERTYKIGVFKIDRQLIDDDQTSVIAAKAHELGMRMAMRKIDEQYVIITGMHFGEYMMRLRFKRGADARAYFRSQWSKEGPIYECSS